VAVFSLNIPHIDDLGVLSPGFREDRHIRQPILGHIYCRIWGTSLLSLPEVLVSVTFHQDPDIGTRLLWTASPWPWQLEDNADVEGSRL